VAYGHWLSEAVALRVSAGAMAARVTADVTGSGVFTETAAVSQLLLGMRYYFPRSTYGSAVRPFLGAGIGAIIGSQVASDISAGLAFALMTDFGEPIGGSDNYSGPQLTLGFSWVFGG
jgi:outer membrane protein W